MNYEYNIYRFKLRSCLRLRLYIYKIHTLCLFIICKIKQLSFQPHILLSTHTKQICNHLKYKSEISLLVEQQSTPLRQITDFNKSVLIRGYISQWLFNLLTTKHYDKKSLNSSLMPFIVMRSVRKM